jgi:hypothetical protein
MEGVMFICGFDHHYKCLCILGAARNLLTHLVLVNTIYVFIDYFLLPLQQQIRPFLDHDPMCIKYLFQRDFTLQDQY